MCWIVVLDLCLVCWIQVVEEATPLPLGDLERWLVVLQNGRHIDEQEALVFKL
jgi:hypothetical protein